MTLSDIQGYSLIVSLFKSDIRQVLGLRGKIAPDIERQAVPVRLLSLLYCSDVC